MSVALVGHVGPWTIEDVEGLPDSGDHARYELLTPGVLTVSPAPGTVHQRASRRLANLLEAAASAAMASVEVLETVNLEIAGGRLAVADIAVVDREFAATNPTRYPCSAVLTAVEIVSPSTHPQDRLIKPQLYAQARIGTYWRLELEPTPHLIVSTLVRGQYRHAVAALAGKTSQIEMPFPVRVDPAALVRQ